MSFVRTVAGDIAPNRLGVTACHEHLILDSPLVAQRYPHIHLDSVEDAVAELAPWRAAGLGTVVDAMPVAQGSDPARLAAVGRGSGVHVVAATGLHTARYDIVALPASVEDLAGKFVAYLTAPDHPCGVIKVATGPEGIDDRARLLFSAAAEAARITGAPLLTHCEEGAGGIEQVMLLMELGVDSGRVTLSHTDKVPDLGYHGELLSSGVNLVYDQALRQPVNERRGTAWLIEAMVAAGYAERLMLGTDGARRSLWTSLGGSPGLAWLHSGFVPELARRGLDQGTLDTLLVANPARWLTLAV